MCAIGGFIFKDFEKLEEKKSLVVNLLREMERRGTDATGICCINTIENSVNVYKQPVKSTEFVKDKSFIKFLKQYLNRSNVVLLHTRLATTGAKEDNKNNHPIYKKELNSVLIHNGVISNHRTIKEDLNLNCDGEVDSEVILELFHKYNGDFNKIHTLLMGSYSFVLYHNPSLYLVKHSNPLFLGYIKELDCITFASTEEIINDSLKEYEEYENWLFYEKKIKYDVVFRELEDNEVIKFNFEELKYTFEEGKMEFDSNFRDEYNLEHKKDNSFTSWKDFKDDDTYKKREDFTSNKKYKRWLRSYKKKHNLPEMSELPSNMTIINSKKQYLTPDYEKINKGCESEDYTDFDEDEKEIYKELNREETLFCYRCGFPSSKCVCGGIDY